MIINTPYVPTATLLKEAEAFTNFDTDLSVEKDEVASKVLGKTYFKVTKSFRYYLSEAERNVWGYVPAGFLTDGASVPKPLWWILPPWGRYGQAAVLHDILCETKTMFRDEIPYEISRKQADHIFRDAMKVAGVHWFERGVMFTAVRAWGIFGWRPSKKRMEAKRRIESEYMKEYGTYREPTAILSQVAKAMKKTPHVQLQAI
ncbi:tail assembly chaperone [Xanthomonas phage RTH11]|nr:tail assembly chaperone [Xanthomonas phage RTH11]